MRRFSIMAAVFVMAMVGLVPASVAGAGGGPPPDYFVDEENFIPVVNAVTKYLH